MHSPWVMSALRGIRLPVYMIADRQRLHIFCCLLAAACRLLPLNKELLTPAVKHASHLPLIRPRHARRREYQGTGIGLSIGRMIAARLGGSLECRSAGLGHGSTFAFCIPAAGVTEEEFREHRGPGRWGAGRGGSAEMQRQQLQRRGSAPAAAAAGGGGHDEQRGMSHLLGPQQSHDENAAAAAAHHRHHHHHPHHALHHHHAAARHAASSLDKQWDSAAPACQPAGGCGGHDGDEETLKRAPTDVTAVETEILADPMMFQSGAHEHDGAPLGGGKSNRLLRQLLQGGGSGPPTPSPSPPPCFGSSVAGGGGGAGRSSVNSSSGSAASSPTNTGRGSPTNTGRAAGGRLHRRSRTSVSAAAVGRPAGIRSASSSLENVDISSVQKRLASSSFDRRGSSTNRRSASLGEERSVSSGASYGNNNREDDAQQAGATSSSSGGRTTPTPPTTTTDEERNSSSSGAVRSALAASSPFLLPHRRLRSAARHHVLCLELNFRMRYPAHRPSG